MTVYVKKCKFKRKTDKMFPVTTAPPLETMHAPIGPQVTGARAALTRCVADWCLVVTTHLNS